MANEKPADRDLFLHALIWGARIEAMPAWKAAAVICLRLIAVLARDLAHGQVTLRAMGFVYTTLLSLVPLLALGFSVLKAFGVYNQLDPVLLNFLAPLGERSGEVSGWIIKFIENLDIKVLGSIGLALLVYAAVSLMQKIEESFNFIWHVGQLRSFARRFSAYLSVLLIGPVLVFSASLRSGISSSGQPRAGQAGRTGPLPERSRYPKDRAKPVLTAHQAHSPPWSLALSPIFHAAL